MDRDTRDMLLETASRFFAERAGKDELWPALTESRYAA